jgi:hypothetical protein
MARGEDSDCSRKETENLMRRMSAGLLRYPTDRQAGNDADGSVQEIHRD